jgi:hypothetical protein
VARWILKLLSYDPMAERVRTSQALIDLVWKDGKSLLDSMIAMKEYAVPVSMPETKHHSRQQLEKGVSESV